MRLTTAPTIATKRPSSATHATKIPCAGGVPNDVIPGGTLRSTLDQALEHASLIVNATELPVSADLESGFGDPPDVVAKTVGLAAELDSLAEAGVRPISLATYSIAPR